MAVEIQNQNDLQARTQQQAALENSEKAGILEGKANEVTRLAHLTPKEKKEAQATEERLDWYIQKRDIMSINEIVRNTSAKKLIRPDLLRKAFETLRSVHTEEVKKHVDGVNMGAIRDDVAGKLEEVSTGYNEIFKNLQRHLESSGPLDEDHETIIDLQKEVTEAEKSVNQLLRKLTNIGNNPVQIPTADMPPQKGPEETPTNSL